MAITFTAYNHTAKRFLDGSNDVGDTYKLMLCTTATFNAANETLAGATYVEVAQANGYTTGGETLANVAVTTVNTNEAKLDSDDVTWNASGGSITASFGIVYNDTDTNDPLVAFIDFDGSKTAGDGTPFRVVWASTGIVTLSVT